MKQTMKYVAQVFMSHLDAEEYVKDCQALGMKALHVKPRLVSVWDTSVEVWFVGYEVSRP